jgi:DNA-binding transcriptional MerR regulator
MLTIGALARLAGTTTRAVRHYHAVGVLPEPSRRTNGYREYDLRDAVRLVRVRRLVDLGLSLPEIADAVRAGDGDDRELREVLAELDATLARQQEAIGERRAQLARILARETAAGASEEIVDLLRDIAASVPGAGRDEVTREQELLEMVEAVQGREEFSETARQYREGLQNPQRLAVLMALNARFEALAGVDPDDPKVQIVARDLVRAGAEQFPPAKDEPDDESWRPTWQAFLVTLPPAQRRCMELAWEERSQWGS